MKNILQTTFNSMLLIHTFENIQIWAVVMSATHLALTVGAELLTAAVRVPQALLLYILLVLALLLYHALSPNTEEQRLALALLLVPMIRIASLALPLANFPSQLWPAILLAPLLPFTILVAHKVGLASASRHTQSRSPSLQLMLALGGPALGVLAYSILPLNPQASGERADLLWYSTVALAICVGLFQELVFRGIVQSALVKVLGPWGLVWGAAMFAALQFSQPSAQLVAFAFCIGLLFAIGTYLSSSLLGVLLAHGAGILVLLVVIPALHESSARASLEVALVLIGVGAALSLAALLILILHPLVSHPIVVSQVGKSIRASRRASGLSYCELAARTGLPARLLAEIEHGMRAVEPEEHLLINNCLQANAAGIESAG